MSALHKLKAYFGMVPAEYADDPGYDDDRGRYGDYRSEYAAEADDYDPYPRRSRVFTPGRSELGSSGYRADIDESDDYEPETRRGAGANPAGTRRWSADAPVHGALAVDPQREPVSRLRPVAEPAGNPLARITTLHPRNYSEARTIGEHYRDGTPVILNLTDMDDADAKRLVDFSAGLAFALRGSMDKITSRVFLLSPPNVDVTAEDRRKLAEGGFGNRG